MIQGIALPLFANLVGEGLRQVLGLPIPGPVIGMLLVASAMLLRARYRRGTESGARSSIEQPSAALVSHMSLLFVAAGVGILAIPPIPTDSWLPLSVALFGSTIVTCVFQKFWTAVSQNRGHAFR